MYTHRTRAHLPFVNCLLIAILNFSIYIILNIRIKTRIPKYSISLSFCNCLALRIFTVELFDIQGLIRTRLSSHFEISINRSFVQHTDAALCWCRDRNTDRHLFKTKDVTNCRLELKHIVTKTFINYKTK